MRKQLGKNSITNLIYDNIKLNNECKFGMYRYRFWQKSSIGTSLIFKIFKGILSVMIMSKERSERYINLNFKLDVIKKLKIIIL